MKTLFTSFATSLVLLCSTANGQDNSMLDMLNDSLTATTPPMAVTSAFKATQIINMVTVEAVGKRTLQFMIMHRFGELSDGAYALFGLDNAEIRFGLDYGITRAISVGVGRSSLDKAYDANLKIKLLQQTPGRMPVSVSVYGLLTHTTFPLKNEKPFLNARLRTAYTSQLLIARKFNSRLSLQLSPTLLHFNLVPSLADKNTMAAMAAGGRFKVTKRISINAEYDWLFGNPVTSYKQYPSLSTGLDIETGGHVFQLVFTNSRGMTAPYYLAKTLGTWQKGNIYFGFNVSRVFNFNK